MEKTMLDIYATISRVSTIFKADVEANCEENFYIELIDANDTVEVWLYFDAQSGFVYPKELMLKTPNSFEMKQIEALITVNIDVWKKTYGDKYLKPDWNY